MTAADNKPDPIQNQEQIRRRQRAAWQSIMQISDQLLQCATQKDWDSIERLHKKREQMLDLFFREILIQDLIPEVQQGITKIREQDSDIVLLVKNNRDELGAESRRLQSMKSRIKEYLSAEQQKLE